MPTKGPWEDYKPAEKASGPWDAYKPREAETVGEMGEAALAGFGQGALMGYMPQVRGALETGQKYVEKGLGKLGVGPAALDEELKAKGFKLEDKGILDTYLAERDAEIKRLEGMQEMAPGSFALGQLGGAVATAPMAGKAALGALKLAGKAPGALGAAPRLAEGLMKAKGFVAPEGQKLSALQKLGNVGLGTIKGAVGGAAQAAAQNVGDTEGQLGGLQLGERAEAAKTGAMLGGAVPVVGSAIGGAGKAIASVPERLKTMSETRAAAALGLNKGFAKKLIKQDPTGMEGASIKELGKFVQDKGIVQPGDELIDIAQKVANVKKATGEAIAGAYDAAEAALSGKTPLKGLSAQAKKELSDTIFDKRRMVSEFRQAVEQKFTGQAGGEQAKKAALAEIENFGKLQGQKLSIKQLQEFKSGLDDIIFAHDRTPGNLPANSAALKEFRDFIKTKINARINAIDKHLGSDIGVNLKELNKQYGLASTADKITRDRLAAETGNNFLSLTDKMALFGGAGVGAATAESPEQMLNRALLGAGAGLLSKGARTYGRPMLMSGARIAGQALEAVPPNLPSAMQAGAGLVKKAPGAAGAAAVRGLLTPENKKKD